MRKERVGFAMCGSFCTHERALGALREIVTQYETVQPILSETASRSDTRFGTAEDLIRQLESLTGRPVWSDIRAVEPIGPKGLLDILIVAPCTGNTLAKLACGITDTAATMAAKAHLRSGKPVVLAISTNDGLSAAAKNIGELLVRKNYYFVPFGQDSPTKKPCSLVAEFALLPATVEAALKGEQLQPILCAK